MKTTKPICLKKNPKSRGLSNIIMMIVYCNNWETLNYMTKSKKKASRGEQNYSKADNIPKYDPFESKFYRTYFVRVYC